MTTSWSPAACTCSMSQCTVAMTPSIDGPQEVGCQLSPANLSPPLVANVLQRSIWSSASTLLLNEPEAWIRGQVEDVCAGQNSTSGGSSDTDVNDWQAKPTGMP